MSSLDAFDAAAAVTCGVAPGPGWIVWVLAEAAEGLMSSSDEG